ncbi:MAG: hypothetical protein LBL13_10920 [Bacteroidales bacterium]|jgi:hypothetical protein|nr:hypothetical protein [Bacteroidales bacterium]
MRLKQFVYLILCITLLFGCSKRSEEDSSTSAERNVVSDETTTSFKEILMLINLKTTDSTFLVVKSIDSVTIFVNNKFWSQSSSQSIDINNIEKSVNGNKYETNNKLNYLLIAEQTDTEKPDYLRAGDFAQYLNESLDLKPGHYACLIESFQVTFNDNTVRKYYPFEYRIFKVEPDSKSSSLGEIELKIN